MRAGAPSRAPRDVAEEGSIHARYPDASRTGAGGPAVRCDHREVGYRTSPEVTGDGRSSGDRALAGGSVRLGSVLEAAPEVSPPRAPSGLEVHQGEPVLRQGRDAVHRDLVGVRRQVEVPAGEA